MTHSNILFVERVIRYVFGSVILLGILHFNIHPVVAFIAAYAILTAMIAWEPFYALYGTVKAVIPLPRFYPRPTKEPVLNT